MKILRLYTSGKGIFADARPSIDGPSDKAQFEFCEYGVLIRREKHPSIVVPFTNVSYLVVEEEAKPATAALNATPNQQAKRA